MLNGCRSQAQGYEEIWSSDLGSLTLWYLIFYKSDINMHGNLIVWIMNRYMKNVLYHPILDLDGHVFHVQPLSYSMWWNSINLACKLIADCVTLLLHNQREYVRNTTLYPPTGDILSVLAVLSNCLHPSLHHISRYRWLMWRSGTTLPRLLRHLVHIVASITFCYLCMYHQSNTHIHPNNMP